MDSEDDCDVLDTSKIKYIGTFDEQVDAVMEYIHLKRDEVESLNRLVSDLHDVLSLGWRDIKVLGFGSIVTGLGIRTSDLDCYIQLPSWLHPPDKSFVIKARNILMQHQHLFQHIFTIAHAKVPIVQCLHVPTQVHCDISFNSAAGVANSNLIAYLLNTDKKALRLAILIKYWSKIHELTGMNLMSSYCLTLLVIFFLQQINMLPSVAEIQQNVEENYIDEWNSAFSTSDHKNRNSLPLYELLGEFFKFYRTFEFDKYIVSPYLGKPVSRELFAKIETVPLTFSQYTNNVGVKKFKPIRLDSLMCIQDPFEHNRNCAVAVYPKLTEKIKAQIQRAVTLYENESDSNFLKKVLQRCMTENSPVEKKKKKNHPPLNGVRKTYRRNPNLHARHMKQNFRQNYFRGRNQRN